ncbi:unnamed protein product [Leptosia nina]|uniref:Methylated-DNA--protein-cysteine methyltransferase n=1 Tax=Leptosia nina TaxID=320188 RepID=A0AAV1JS47_9NEOP
MKLSGVLDKYTNGTSTLYVNIFDSPIGKIIAVGDEEFVYIVCFEDSKNLEKMFKSVAKELSCTFELGKTKLLEEFENEIESYFDGELKEFTVPIKTIGSDFQKEVWEMLRKQKYGTTQTYADLAKALGRSGTHARAIGAACGANAHLVVVPCHRVVASASKGGFSCGLDRKEWLLQHEQKHLK